MYILYIKFSKILIEFGKGLFSNIYSEVKQVLGQNKTVIRYVKLALRYVSNY